MEGLFNQNKIGVIQSDDYYVWDNWGFIANDGTLHIYAQYCDKNLCKVPEDRYWKVHIEHFTSQDGGRSFAKQGPAIEKSKNNNAFDSYNIWSGCNFPLEDGRILGLYTGLQYPKHTLPEGRKFALQSIGLAVSYDGGYTFIKEEHPLISPILHYEELKEKGYYLGPKETLGAIDDPDGTFMCLRDPEVFQESGQLHIVFGSKAVVYKDGKIDIRNAVGHAIIKDSKNLQEIAIQKPLFIANEKDYNQLELPGLIKREGMYYLIISTTKLDYIGQTDTEVEKTVRIYKSSQLSEGDFLPYGNQGKHIILRNKVHGIYGPKLVHEQKEEKILPMRPFIVGETYAPPAIGVKVGGENPEVLFHLDLKTY